MPKRSPAPIAWPSLHEADDAPRDQAGDLHHARRGAFGRRDDKRIALVVVARLVEIGVEELARLIDDALDAAGDRAAVHVAVEHAHEDRDARQRLVAESELRRRHRGGDLADAAVGGRRPPALRAPASRAADRGRNSAHHSVSIVPIQPSGDHSQNRTRLASAKAPMNG